RLLHTTMRPLCSPPPAICSPKARRSRRASGTIPKVTTTASITRCCKSVRRTLARPLPALERAWRRLAVALALALAVAGLAGPVRADTPPAEVTQLHVERGEDGL